MDPARQRAKVGRLAQMYSTGAAAIVRTPFNRFLENGRQKWGDKFVPPKTNQQQRAFYHSNTRVEVVSPGGYTRRGCISATTGWEPSLMLMHRRGSSGSWDLLTADDVIVATIIKGKRYPVPHDELQVAVYTGRVV